jgi:peptide deformylase
VCQAARRPSVDVSTTILYTPESDTNPYTAAYYRTVKHSWYNRPSIVAKERGQFELAANEGVLAVQAIDGQNQVDEIGSAMQYEIMSKAHIKETEAAQKLAQFQAKSNGAFGRVVQHESDVFDIVEEEVEEALHRVAPQGRKDLYH